MNPQHSTIWQVSDEEIQKRIIARFVNEAIYCLQDGVIRNPVRRQF